jgi:hypothetical protein
MPGVQWIGGAVSGNTWKVAYIGPRAIEARITYSNTESGVVRCGSAQAVWRAEVDSDDGHKVVFLLWPVDPHSIDPALTVPELPIPVR